VANTRAVQNEVEKLEALAALRSQLATLKKSARVEDELRAAAEAAGIRQQLAWTNSHETTSFANGPMEPPPEPPAGWLDANVDDVSDDGSSSSGAPEPPPEDLDFIDALERELTVDDPGDALAAVQAQLDSLAAADDKMSEYAAMLQKVPLLRSLTDSERQKLAGSLATVEFEDGEAIVSEGEDGDAMFILQSGAALATVRGKVVKEYASGAFFGELALLSNQPRAATVKASGFSTTVLGLGAEDFKWLLEKNKAVKAMVEQQASSYSKQQVALDKAEDKMEEYAALLQKVPLLKSLTGEERQKIAGCLIPIEFDDDDDIVTEGESGDVMFILQSGSAQAIVGIDPAIKGSGKVVVEYESGAFFGELALLSKRPRAATIKASGFSTTVLGLRTEDFHWLMETNADIKALVEKQASSYTKAEIALDKAEDKLEEYAAMLQKVPMLKALTDEERQKLAGSLITNEFDDGQRIVTEGEAGDVMFILQSGSAQAFVKDKVVMEYEAGAFFGELALLSKKPRAATIKASGFNTVVLGLRTEDFHWLMDKNKAIKALVEKQANSYTKQRFALDKAEDKMEEYAAMLQKVPLLKSVSAEERQKLAGSLIATEFDDGEAIVTEGEAGDVMFILQSGSAQAFVKDQVVKEYEAGSFFGELALLSKKPRAATIKASGFNTVVLGLRTEDFHWLMDKNKAIKALVEKQANSYTKQRFALDKAGDKMEEYAAMLQKVPLLQPLSDAERQKIAGCLIAIEFDDGEAIVSEGEAGDSMYILQSGSAQALVRGQVVVEYASGAFFGELALLSNQPRAATVKASGFSTTVLGLGAEDFKALLEQNAAVRSFPPPCASRRPSIIACSPYDYHSHGRSAAEVRTARR
jgi:CRP-like cAMP-binding protein